jgi:hypothetical protein
MSRLVILFARLLAALAARGRRVCPKTIPPALSLVLLSGCATNLPAPRGASAGPVVAGEAWARVLAKQVDDRGRIDFAGIAAAPEDLDAYVPYVGSVSPISRPDAFPTREAKLAYYLNAYNALAMSGIVQAGIPESLAKIKFRFFYRNRFVVGGQRISLYKLENGIVRKMGDPRIHFALNCMVRGCPRLPKEPFEAARLEIQLDAAARLFLSEARNVDLRPDAKTVRFSEILRFYTKDFLAVSPSLIAYANQYRTEKIPGEWKVEFIPYDWTVNKP